MISHFKFALRSLSKSPGFVATAIVLLSVGIGMNTSMFTLLDLLVLRPLPYPDRAHLIRIYRTTPQSQDASHSAVDYLELARQGQPLTGLAAYRMWGYTLAEEGHPPMNLNALRVSASFFPTIGLQPELGRTFTPDEDRPGNHVIMFSHATWMARFGGDPGVIGRVVRIDGVPTTIIGVMPAAFSALTLWGPGDAFRPLALTDTEKMDSGDASLQIIGRFTAGTSLAQVNAQLRALAPRLTEHLPREYRDDSLRAVTLQSSAANTMARRILSLLLALAGFVLLIVCANLANLQLARASVRNREFAICAALGASRGRLLQPLLAESLLLACGGGAGGVLVAMWSNAWLSQHMSARAPVVFDLSVDWRSLGFALVVSAATGLLFGIVPAWLMSRVNVSDTLKSGARGATGDRAQRHFRHLLVVGQFALALTLLAGAGFFIRGLDRLLARDLGWNSHGMLQCVLNLPEARYSTPAQTYAFYTQLDERLRALPGAENVAIGWTLPLFTYLSSRSVTVEGRQPPPPGHEPVAFINGVTPSYLDTLKIKLLSGRNFTDADTATSPAVVIINASMARALFPHENPLGQHLDGLLSRRPGAAEIVGVMDDVKLAAGVIPLSTPFLIFRPLTQETWNYVTVAVRAAAPERLADAMRQAVGALDSNIPLQQLSTVDEYIAVGTGGMSLVSSLLSGFALLGLFLAALGLYGVIARLVAQRTPEIGLRIALGAQARDVLWLMLGSGLRLVLLGAGLGLLGAFGLARLMSAIAPEMSVQGLPVVAAVTVLLTGVATAACYLPARRATRVDPVVALRAE